MTSTRIGRTRTALLAACALFPWAISAAQTPSAAPTHEHIELFGGYAYANTNTTASGSGIFICPGTNCPIAYTYDGSGANLNGWETTAAVPLHHNFSAVADVTGAYGTATLISSLNINGTNATISDRQHLFTYLFGPQISSHKRLAPFAQILLGVAHQSQTTTADPFELQSNPAPATTFALAVGGGLDVKLTKHLTLRPIQVRVLITRFNSDTQFQPTISAGLVLHL
jgi:opacity protein-like surface antigen